MLKLSEIMPDSPIRRPNWRALRAVNMLKVSGRATPRHGDDSHVRRYHRFLVGLRTAGNDNKRREAVACRDPSLGKARSLYYSRDTETRIQIEARLLTDESMTKLGQRFGVSETVIKIYEKLFFNVRDRLDAPDYLRLLIRTEVRRAAPEYREQAQRAYAMRWFALAGGTYAIDAFLGMHSLWLKLERDPSGFPDATFSLLVRAVTALVESDINSDISFDSRDTARLLRCARKLMDSEERTPAEDTEEKYRRIFNFLTTIETACRPNNS